MKSAIPNKDDNKEVDESSGSWSNPDFNNGDSCREHPYQLLTLLCVLSDIPQ